jgi:capsular polysaccharide biosynthesis protein
LGKNRSVRSLESDINLFELFRAMLSNLHWILIISMLAGGLMWGISSYSVKSVYDSEDVYSVRTNLKDSVLFSQIILQDSFLSEVERSIGLDESLQRFRSHINIETVLTSSDLDTTYIKVVVKWDDKIVSKKISDKISMDFMRISKSTLPLEEIFVVSSMVIQTVNRSRAILLNSFIGFLIGAIVSLGYVMIMYLFDQHIRSAEEMADLTGIPIVVNIEAGKQSRR